MASPNEPPTAPTEPVAGRSAGEGPDGNLARSAVVRERRERRLTGWLAGIGVAVFLAFAVWSLRTVVVVQTQRDNLRENVLRLMDTNALLKARALPAEADLAPLSEPKDAAAAAAFERMREAVVAEQLPAFEEAANDFIVALRADSARISTMLGQKFDALNLLVGFSLAAGIGVLGLFVLAQQRRFEAQRLTRRVQAAVAEMQRARDRAQAADDLKTRLLADVSHELRTPMVGLMGGLELLRGATLPSAAERRVEDLHDAALGLRQILDDLIDLARIDGGSINIQTRSFDPRRLVRSAVALMEGQFPRERIDVRGLDQLPDALTGAADRIRQVLTNLLSNACKYAPGTGITVTASYADGQLDLCVDDGGAGIGAEHIERAFSPFERLDREDTLGTGLGLSVSRGLARAMAGRLQLGPSPAGGLRACLCVPATLAKVAPPPSSAASDGFHPPLRVLLAEDNEINREIVGELLTQLGYEVTLARNGREALEMCEAQSPEVVLMDCQMPVLGGIDATKELRRTGFGAPIVALTATVGSSERDACLSAGMDAVMSKPVTGDQLEKTLAKWGKTARTRGA